MINLRHNFSPIIVSDHDQDCLKFIVPKYGLQFHSYSNFDSILVTDIENQCPDSAQSHLLVIKFSASIRSLLWDFETIWLSENKHIYQCFYLVPNFSI